MTVDDIEPYKDTGELTGGYGGDTGIGQEEAGKAEPSSPGGGRSEKSEDTAPSREELRENSVGSE